MLTLVSVLGAQKAGYETCTYRFDDGFEWKTSLFGYAALRRLKQTGSPADRWVLLGTNSSDWLALHAICEESGVPPVVGGGWSRLAEEIVAGGAQQSTLNEIGAAISPAIGSVVRPRIITNDADSVFTTLHDELSQDAAVVLDITHGFRTIPMYCVLALGALRWIKGVKVADLVYGQLGADNPSGAAVSLKQGALLAEIGPLAAKVSIADDLGAAADICERLGIGDDNDRRALRQQAVQESLLYGDLAHAERQKVANRLASWNCKRAGITGITGRWIRDTVGVPGGFPAGHHFKRAVAFAKKGDHLRALLLIVDAYRLEVARWARANDAMPASEACKAMELAGCPRDLIAEIRMLNGLRNSSAHGDQRKQGRLTALRGDPVACVAFIRKMIDRFPGFQKELAGTDPPSLKQPKSPPPQTGKARKKRRRRKRPPA
jgi:CRISPR-associated Csx2 family protein